MLFRWDLLFFFLIVVAFVSACIHRSKTRRIPLWAKVTARAAMIISVPLILFCMYKMFQMVDFANKALQAFSK